MLFQTSPDEPILHPIAIAQVMVNFARSFGVDTETCLLGTGISLVQLQDSETLITRTQEMRLIENLILALPDEPALGFRLGLQYNISTFGAWGFALRTSRTLREAGVMALRYLPLSTAYCDIRNFEEDGYFAFMLDPTPIPPPLRQFLLERDMATGINLVKELSLAGVHLSKLELQGDAPDYAKELERLVGLKPHFNSQRNAVFVTLAEADRCLPTYDAHLVQLMQLQCRQQLQRRQSSGVAGQVRQQLLGSLGFIATVEEVATALAMSPRSLRRKLENEDTSFKKLLDQERQQMALQLLKSSDMKLDELAFHLGYTDTASFSRAFRRWKGCAPGEFRKSC